MISIEEQQALNRLSEISQNTKALVAPMKEWVRKQREADEKKTARRKTPMGNS